MRAASATVRTNVGVLPRSKAQRSQSRSSGSVLAEHIICNIHRGATESAGCILVPVRDCLVEHSCRLRRSRKEAAHAEVPARRLRQG